MGVGGVICGSDRNRLRLLLASSSLAAILIGSGTPQAYAASCVINDVSNSAGAGPFNNTTNSINCINIQNSTVNGGAGNVSNTSPGVIATTSATLPTAIRINNSTLIGAIINTGSITATIGNGEGVVVISQAFVANGITNSGNIAAQSNGIEDGVEGFALSSFAGGITNSGTIVASGFLGAGISSAGVSTFTGGINNGGTISAALGITLANFSSFSGGISNSGTISGSFASLGLPVGISVDGTGHVVGASPATLSGGITNSGIVSGGIGVEDLSTFASGNLSNSGTISSTNNAIVVTSITDFTGNITNNGTISAGAVGIFVGQTAASFGGVSTFAGNISNSGTITAKTGIAIVGSTIHGSIVDNGVLLGSSHGITVDSASKLIANTATAIAISGPTFTGGISNAGTILGHSAALAIVLTGSTFAGGIANSGVIGGIKINGVTTYGGGVTNSVGATIGGGIFIETVSAFSGGITNSGTITGVNSVVVISGVSSFSGSIVNNAGGFISAFGPGIDVTTVSTFTGGITNAGTISTGSRGRTGLAGVSGILVTSVSTFTGNIVNAGTGTISAGATGTGINVNTVKTFTGNISNAGTITGGFGVRVGNGVTSGGVDIQTFAGSVSNSGRITAATTGIQIVGVSSFGGNIANSGTISAAGIGIDIGFKITIGTLTINRPVSTFTGNIANSGTITAKTGIDIVGSTINGSVSDSGNIIASSHGILIDSASKLATNGTAIKITGPTFTGGITNSGTISTTGNTGISVGNSASVISTFGGGISNAGTVSSVLSAAIAAGGGGGRYFVSQFSGGVTNSGAVTGWFGIYVGGISTFSGNVVNSGTGTVTAFASNGSGVGPDAIVVQLISTFAGGVTNAGKISGQVGINVSSVVQFGSSSAGGGISNSGTITATIGQGIYVNNVSTFFGGITNSGTLSAALTGIGVIGVSTFSGGIVNSGTISAGGAGISVAGVTTFSGNISNAGAITGNVGIFIGAGVTFSGGAAIVNSGNITDAPPGGAIDVSNATSPVIIDQNGGTLTGAIKLSSNTDVLNIAGGVINGNIIGLGSHDTINFALGSGTFTYGSGFGFSTINQVNVSSGTVILNGTNSATNIAVSGGDLEVGDAADTGAQLTGAVNVTTAGTLSGHGTVVGAVTIGSGGNLMPGGSIGTLTINGGPLVFGSNATYTEQLSPTQHALTNVIGAPGTVSINSSAEIEFAPQLGTYSATKFPIITSTGTITGTFSPTFTYTGNVRLNAPTLSYDANDVYLSYAASTSTLQLPLGATINQQDVANGINNVIIGGTTPPPGFQDLAGLSDGALLHALDELSGEVGPAFIAGAFTADDLFLRLITNTYNFDRGGGFGPPTAFAAEQPMPSPLPDDVALAYASVVKAPAVATPPTFAQRWSAWGAAYGGGGVVGGDPVIGSHNTSSSVYGYAGGLDYRATADTVVGFALGGGGTGWGLTDALGSGHSYSFNSALYASNRWGPLYLTAALADSVYEVHTTRNVTVAGADTLAADFSANVVSARFEGGYRYGIGTYGLTPYGAVQAQWMQLPQYSENATSGSPQFALTYAAQNPTDVRSELGAGIDTSVLLNGGDALKLYARAAWTHDSDRNPAATASFQTLPGANFLVYAAKPDADSALVTAGAKYLLGNGWSVVAKFDGDFSGNTSLYAGSGTLRYSW